MAVVLTVNPDDCDASGLVSHRAFLRLFERARWDAFADGTGEELFTRRNGGLVVRRGVQEFHAPVRPGERLRFDLALTHLGRTSFAVRQTARRLTDDTVVATAEHLLVCLDDQGQPQPIPETVGRFFSAQRAEEPSDRVTVNGVSLAIETRGSGPAIVFVHGFPLDRTIWRHQMDTLTGYRRISLDLRGMGQSDAPDLGYSMATYADDLAGVLDALGEERVVICGLSMGGYVAFEFLRRYRSRVRGLILMDTRAEADSAEGRRARDSLIAKVRDQGPIAAAEAMLPRFFTATVPAEIIQAIREMILRTPVPGIVGALSAMRERPDSSPLLPTLVGVPSLVVVGQEDMITPPAVAQAMSVAIPEARVIEIPGAGHIPPVEQPVPTTRAVLKFLQGLRLAG